MRTAPFVFALALLAGCAATNRPYGEGRYDRPVPTEAKVRAVPRGVVPSGTDGIASLEDPIGTRVSRAGDGFVAHLDQPLVTNDGREIAHAGAIVRGHVVRIDGGENPVLRVALDTIETIDGPVRVHATILEVGRYAIVGVAKPSDDFDASLHAPIGRHAQVGGGPRDPRVKDPFDTPVSDVYVPRGAKLRVMLLDDLRPLARAHGR